MIHSLAYFSLLGMAFANLFDLNCSLQEHLSSNYRNSSLRRASFDTNRPFSEINPSSNEAIHKESSLHPHSLGFKVRSRSSERPSRHNTSGGSISPRVRDIPIDVNAHSTEPDSILDPMTTAKIFNNPRQFYSSIPKPIKTKEFLKEKRGRSNSLSTIKEQAPPNFSAVENERNLSGEEQQPLFRRLSPDYYQLTPYIGGFICIAILISLVIILSNGRMVALSVGFIMLPLGFVFISGSIYWLLHKGFFILWCIAWASYVLYVYGIENIVYLGILGSLLYVMWQVENYCNIEDSNMNKDESDLDSLNGEIFDVK
jgi:hypothetical protein